jgi:dTDP-4-amino-4,6-dideoxygalactose transaminase
LKSPSENLPMNVWKVPLADVTLGPEEIAAVTEVLQSGWLSMGPKTQEFEEHFAQFLGVKHAFAVANGTAALHLACEVVGLSPGDEVLCPALTFVASANAILYTGAQPVFVDVSSTHDLNLAVDDAAAKVSGRTKAMMVVHYGGYPADMDAIAALANRHRLKIIEDCAHAPGAVYQSRQGPRLAGTLGDVGCFSFFSNKNLTTGEGGMAVTDDDELAEKIKSARSHGMTTLTWDRYRGHSFSYDVVARGYNYRLDEMRAALGLVQLNRLEPGNARRRELTHAYRAQLQDLDHLEVPFRDSPPGSAHHLFPILLKDPAGRADFMAALAQEGIQTSIHYPPVHLFSHYRSLWEEGHNHRLPLTEQVASRLVTLPLYPSLTIEQLDTVVAAIHDYFR